MAPPQTAPEQTPYFWYNLGGGAFNLIFALLALAPVWACRKTAPYAALFLMVFALCGAVVGLSNLIPMRAGGLANDGENARTLGKDPYSRRLFWIQLQVNALATQGMRLGQMQAQWFDLPENPDYTNSMVAAVAGMRVSRLIDLGQEQEAAALADQMLACPGLLGLLSLEARCERLYLAVMAAIRKSSARWKRRSWKNISAPVLPCLPGIGLHTPERWPGAMRSRPGSICSDLKKPCAPIRLPVKLRRSRRSWRALTPGSSNSKTRCQRIVETKMR